MVNCAFECGAQQDLRDLLQLLLFVTEKYYLSKNLTLYFSLFSLTICHHHQTLLSLQLPCYSIHLPSFLSLHFSCFRMPSHQALHFLPLPLEGRIAVAWCGHFWEGLSSHSAFGHSLQCEKTGHWALKFIWAQMKLRLRINPNLKFLILLPAQLFSDSH